MLSPRKAVLTPYALRHMTSSIVYKDSQRRLSRGNYIPIRVCSYMSWASTSCTASRENSPEWDQFNSVIPLLWGCAVQRHWGKRVSLKPEFFTQTRIKISHSPQNTSKLFKKNSIIASFIDTLLGILIQW